MRHNVKVNENITKYFFLGIFVAYVIIAIQFFFFNVKIPAWLLLTIARISWLCALFELAKASLKKTIAIYSEKEHRLLKNEYNRIERENIVFSNYKSLENIVETNNRTKEELDKITQIDNSRKIKTCIKVYKYVSIGQMICVAFWIIIMPFACYNKSAINIKEITFLTIITFAFMFLTFFINEEKSFDNYVDGFTEAHESLTNTYLDSIEKIHNEVSENGLKDELKGGENNRET